MNTYWHFLQNGDEVDIIAPGYGCAPEMLQKAVAFLASLGLVAHMPEGLLGEDPFSAHSDEARLQHVMNALNNPRSKAIWCLRGGYGSARLLPALLQMAPPEQVKLLIGFSDITALHLLFLQHFGWPTLHAGILTAFCHKTPDDDAVQTMLSLLHGTTKTLHFPTLLPLNDAAKEPRTIHSTITGGNLSLLQTSIGTAWQLQSKGKILLIEEVGERGYRIDRMLMHLTQASLFDGVEAVLIGDIIGDEEKDGRSLGQVAIARFAASTTLPVLHCPGIGHGTLNHPLAFGTDTTLILGNTPSLYAVTGGI